MNKLLYVAMSGAKSVMARQATNNNNLANINTTGFREDLDAAVSYPVTDQGGLSTRVYVDVQQVGINAKRGTVINTGRDLDIAIEGDGLIAVLKPDGTEAYTRAGNLKLSPDGLIESADGFPIAGNNGPIIVPPYQTLDIAKDGTISIMTLGDSSGTLAVIDRIKLVNPDMQEMQKNENGLLELRPRLSRTTTITATPDGRTSTTELSLVNNRNGITADGSVNVASGALETSNVNPAYSLITMVELSRLFETQIRLMKTAEENDAAINRILA